MKLEEEIAESLFTDGDGQKALRLVLERPDKINGGGWCLDAVRNLIGAALADQEILRQKMGGYLYSRHSTLMIRLAALHREIESIENEVELIEELYAETGGDVNHLEHKRRGSFQERVQPWMLKCFGSAIAADTTERNHRFLEEALELVQACGCTRSEALQLVDYVYGRAIGEKSQEVGGVMVTLAALCLAQEIDMHDAGETELSRIWLKIAEIREKQAKKPRNSPLPE